MGTMLSSMQQSDALVEKQDADVILAHLSDGVTFPYRVSERDKTPLTDFCRLLLLPSDFPRLNFQKPGSSGHHPAVCPEWLLFEDKRGAQDITSAHGGLCPTIHRQRSNVAPRVSRQRRGCIICSSL